MAARTLSRIVVVLCLILGLTCLSVRRQGREATHRAVETSRWRLTYDVSFDADEADAIVRIAIPSPTRHASIIDSEMTYPDLDAEVVSMESGNYRFIEARAGQAGRFRVTAGFLIELDPTRSSWGLGRLTELSADARTRYLREEETLPVRSANLQRILQQSVGQWETEEQRLQWIYNYCTHKVKRASGQSATNEVSNIIDPTDPSAAAPLGRARLMVALCRAARMPARLVTGFELRQQEPITPHVWVEVFGNSRWRPFDPVNDYAWTMPVHFIPARRGQEGIVRPSVASTVSQLSTNFSLIRLPPPSAVLASSQPHPSQILDLTRLPVEMHEVMSLLLLVPLGALITALFRNVIGIRTFGTFAPALLAMSFLYADWTTGLVILSVVILAGLAGRNLLERLHLLMVPRLSIILTVIILCVLFSVSALDYLSLTPSADAVLLPLVILTIMIERFYVTAEEDGVGFSLQLIVGTLVVASFCYVLLMRQEVGQLILIYPEIHFFTIAAFIWIGRYTGYRLTELWRFRDLVDVETTPPAMASAAGTVVPPSPAEPPHDRQGGSTP